MIEEGGRFSTHWILFDRFYPRIGIGPRVEALVELFDDMALRIVAIPG